MLMSTHNIQFHDKIRKFPLIFVFLSYRKNFIGTQKRVRICHGKRVIGVWAIEVRLYYCIYLMWTANGLCYPHMIKWAATSKQCTFRFVHQAKIKISLRIRAVWSDFSLGIFWINKNAMFIQANEDNEYSDQTAWTRRLIWAFAGPTCWRYKWLKWSPFCFADR